MDNSNLTFPSFETFPLHSHGGPWSSEYLSIRPLSSLKLISPPMLAIRMYWMPSGQVNLLNVWDMPARSGRPGESSRGDVPKPADESSESSANRTYRYRCCLYARMTPTNRSPRWVQAFPGPQDVVGVRRLRVRDESFFVLVCPGSFVPVEKRRNGNMKGPENLYQVEG
jgi:hypothetical protein